MFPKLVFKEMSHFSRDAVDLLSDFEFALLQRDLTLNPEKGELIQHTGGARKVRIGLSGRGKRGGGRVIYYYQVGSVIHLLLVYPKNAQEDLSSDQTKWVKSMVDLIKQGRM
jgi:mRNA-degrading endonuclease RelE of RelBE toxin-antitoxin system